jgi:hypothetical protein
LEKNGFFSENKKRNMKIIFLISIGKIIKYSRNFKSIIKNEQKKESGNGRVEIF